MQGELFEFQKGMNGEKKWSNSNVHTITKLQINTLVIIIKNIKKYKEKKIIKNRPISILLFVYRV